QALVNKPLSAEQEDAVFSDEFAQYRRFFVGSNNQDSGLITEQDKAIYSLCRPERLLDLTHRFIVFEHGVKKIARYQQFFVVRNALKRSKRYRDNQREGGIIWHTQGSGKSLTMVMLARALVLDKEIPNPRILLVTDRTDLDEQLGNTFRACGLEEAKKATSGRDLIEHLKGEASIITTLIHKFDKALNAENYTNDSADIFALVDESHRTNFAFFAARMRKMLPNACYIGFTGTPLLKEEKNSFFKFGSLIEPNYSTKQAVDDKAILPLLYEGRLVDIEQDKKAIDKWFERHTKGLTDEQKADLKRKYARANVLNKSDQVIYMRAYDIREHFRENWQGTGFKAQLVAPGKLAAIKYHECLQDIGNVTSEVIISSPDTREGYQEVDGDPTDKVARFWRGMMQRYGSAKEYEKQIIGQFKGEEEPEIIIVVDKLLTGFDAPRNTVLYLCKKLREHTLLQAVARVNRLYEGKEFGYVIDYDNVLEELDKALTMYDAFKEFDEVDLAEALKAASKEVDKLPQKHSDLWAIFKGIDKNDQEAMERFLADKERRDEFRECLTAYGNTLAIALSNDKFLREVSDAELNCHRNDLKTLLKLRKSVQLRYAETIDFGVYEKKIEKLLDTHIHADDVLLLNEPINILDRQSVDSILEDSPIYGSSMSTAAKADAIAHATQKTINEKMDED
ncbi:MAG: HsdR family type I site-specific deoxyribonuclease, partial [Aestuariivita sp.]|nr:HsdR family type I site-specific deoxyribonuclease [Aestuariivita sp.]